MRGLVYRARSSLTHFQKCERDDLVGGCVCVCVLWEVWDFHIHKSMEPPQYVFIAPPVCVVDTICRGPYWPLRAHLTGSDNIVYKLWSKC